MIVKADIHNIMYETQMPPVETSETAEPRGACMKGHIAFARYENARRDKACELFGGCRC